MLAADCRATGTGRADDVGHLQNGREWCADVDGRVKDVWLLLAFVISRVAYYAVGVRFDSATSLPFFCQYIDPELLRHHLWQSLWYLHSQPPTFNLFLGMVLNLFPGHEALAFNICYLVLGATLAVVLYHLLRGFGMSDTQSMIAAIVYSASPVVVLYENWLFYAYPVTVLLVLTALFWQRFFARGRFRDSLLLFACAGLLCLTWSMFHLVWLLGLVIALVLSRRADWRRVLVAAALPVLCVTFWYGKNMVQQGQFTATTWGGMNLSRLINKALTQDEFHTLCADGELSPSMACPFVPLSYYGAGDSSTGVPVLDQRVKSSGVPNFNNRCYVDISRQFLHDGLNVVRRHPRIYLRGIVSAFRVYCRSAGDYGFLDNAKHFRAVARRGLPLAVAFGYALVVLALPFWLLRRPPHWRVLVFLWLCVVWITAVGNLTDYGENNRFRFTADPLVYVLVVVITRHCIEAATRRRRSISWDGEGSKESRQQSTRPCHPSEVHTWSVIQTAGVFPHQRRSSTIAGRPTSS